MYIKIEIEIDEFIDFKFYLQKRVTLQLYTAIPVRIDLELGVDKDFLNISAFHNKIENSTL